LDALETVIAYANQGRDTIGSTHEKKFVSKLCRKHFLAVTGQLFLVSKAFSALLQVGMTCCLPKNLKLCLACKIGFLTRPAFEQSSSLEQAKHALHRWELARGLGFRNAPDIIIAFHVRLISFFFLAIFPMLLRCNYQFI
jgi:hypothetical protein